MRVMVFHWVVRCPVRPRITPPGWDASGCALAPQVAPRPLKLAGRGLAGGRVQPDPSRSGPVEPQGRRDAPEAPPAPWMRASAAWAVSRGNTQSRRMRLWPSRLELRLVRVDLTPHKKYL